MQIGKLYAQPAYPRIEARIPGFRCAASGLRCFDGDGKADILWRDPVSGTNAIWFMNGLTLASYGSVATVPTNWVVARVADYDGDGKADILWRDGATGSNALWLMNGTTIVSGQLLPV